MPRFLAALVFLLATLPATGQETEWPPELSTTERRYLDPDAAAPYASIGRLNVAGRRFCTATLLAPDRVVTAAHCLFNPRSLAPVPLSELRFVAGFHRGDYVALREIVDAAVLPGFVIGARATLDGVSEDLALLVLDREIVDPRITLLPPGALRPDPATIVSYARDRSQAPSIQSPCEVRAAQAGILALACPVNFGASGAPVLAGDNAAREVVAVVSAIGATEAGEEVALAVPLAARIAELEAALGATDWPGGL